MKQVDVVTSIDILAPIAQVANYASNPDNAPSWYKNIKSVNWVSQPPLREGSQLAFVAHFLGRTLAYTYEVVDWIPGQRMVMQTADGPFPMQTIYEWVEVDDKTTRMVLRNKGIPSGFAGIFAPIMAHKMRKANQMDLEAIKHILEQQQ